MARLSIYVQDDLKRRMDAVGDAINWSEVARPAFVSAIANLEHRKSRTVTTAIERLRASKTQHLNTLEEGGKSAGRLWAENSASYADLKAVASIDLTNHDPDEEDVLNGLFGILDPDRRFQSETYDALGIHDPGAMSGPSMNRYAYAFAEGAQEFFEEVEDQL